MSSKIFDKMKTMFAGLSIEERWAFADFTKYSVESQVFDLSFMVKSKENSGIECPHCRNLEPKSIVRFGLRKGIQRYRCKPCGKTFSGVSGTFLSWTKKEFHAWKDFIRSMIEGHSVRKSAAICDIHRNTAFIWRHKILDALTQYHDRQRRMRGVIEVDDTLFPLSYKGSKPVGRDAHKRGTPAKKPGTSKEKVCVSCAIDRNGRVFSRVSALGRTTAKALKRVFYNRFSKRAVVCTDNDRAFAKFAAERKKNKFEHVALNGPTARRGPYNIQTVNSYHSRLRGFIKKFKGVSTKYLNNYLVWCNVIQEGTRNRSHGSGGLGGLAGRAAETLTRASGRGGARLVQQTIMSWDGTTRPQFQVGMQFVASRADDDPRVPAVNLMKRCLPNSGGDKVFAAAVGGALGAGAGAAVAGPVGAVVGGAIGAGAGLGFSDDVLTAPNGYKGALKEVLSPMKSGFGFGKNNKGVEGTCVLLIGTWFACMNLIMTQANFNVSRTVLRSGKPLVCEGQVTFEPYRWMTARELEDCFLGVGVSSSKWVVQS